MCTFLLFSAQHKFKNYDVVLYISSSLLKKLFNDVKTEPVTDKNGLTT